MTLYLVPIVEGETEVHCIERLLQRIWTELLTAPLRLQVLLPSRGKRDALINPKHPDFTAKIEEAYAKLARRLRQDSSAQGLLLLLLDAETDCPKELAPRLSRPQPKCAPTLPLHAFWRSGCWRTGSSPEHPLLPA